MNTLTSLSPYIALLSLIGTSVLSSLYLALSTVARAAVEDIAASDARPHSGARKLRIQRILSDTTAHARGVGFMSLLCDIIVVFATLFWIAHLRSTPVMQAVTGILPDTVMPTWTDALISLPVSLLALWVFSIAVPISVAAYAGPRLVYGRSSLVRLIMVVTTPIQGVARFLDEVTRRLAGAPTLDQQEQVQEDILSVIQEGATTGAIDQNERQMIEAVVGFGDLTVSQIMTPRTEIEALELTNDLGSVIRNIRQIGHSRIPVYDESLDHILGMFYVKDLMHWLAGESPIAGAGPVDPAAKPVRTSKPGVFDLKSILRPTFAVPETKTVRELLKELISKKVHIAIVVDEYGGTAGLVTIEDVVEQIIGDIRDEYESPVAEAPDVVIRAETRTAEIEGTARIVDVNGTIEHLGIQLPESEDYDTVGGFIVTTLGRIPVAGESFQHEQMAITILDAKPTRVVRVSFRVLDDDAPLMAAGGLPVDALAATGVSEAASGHRSAPLPTPTVLKPTHASQVTPGGSVGGGNSKPSKTKLHEPSV